MSVLCQKLTLVAAGGWLFAFDDGAVSQSDGPARAVFDGRVDLEDSTYADDDPPSVIRQRSALGVEEDKRLLRRSRRPMLVAKSCGRS
jgi:hypothetical protein